MSFWSSITHAIKKVWHAVKAAVRVIVRTVITIVWGLTLGLYDLLLGFLTWPPKKLKYHVFILSDAKGPLIDPGKLAGAIDFLTQTFKQRLNVKVDSYGKPGIEIIEGIAPAAALDVHCGAGLLKDEFGDAGQFFAEHLAGWNAIPVSLTFPVTVFVVRSVANGDKDGCSLGPFADYIVIAAFSFSDPDSISTLAHEIGHACNLWHSGAQSNLMWADIPRGNNLHWWQKNLVRSSRHVFF